MILHDSDAGRLLIDGQLVTEGQIGGSNGHDGRVVAHQARTHRDVITAATFFIERFDVVGLTRDKADGSRRIRPGGQVAAATGGKTDLHLATVGGAVGVHVQAAVVVRTGVENPVAGSRRNEMAGDGGTVIFTSIA